MPKSLKDVLAGIKASKIVPGSTGDEPGVDYEPKSPAEQDFVKKHSTEKHSDRVGNGDDVYQAKNVKYSLDKDNKHGHKSPKDKKVYDKKVSESATCNMTEEGSYCPVHEMSSCKAGKTLRELTRKKVNESLAFPLLGGDSDDESAEMAKTQLKAIAAKAMQLANNLSDDEVIEPWVQSKIAVAKDKITAVHDYLMYGNSEKNQEQTAPYAGGIDVSSAPRNTYPSFSVDVNTGRNV